MIKSVIFSCITVNGNLGWKSNLIFSSQGSTSYHNWERRGYTWNYNFDYTSEKLFILRMKVTCQGWALMNLKLDGYTVEYSYLEEKTTTYQSFIVKIPSGSHSITVYCEETYGGYFEKDFCYLTNP